jgi:HPt (histidine-containing phosphotransfer) domain-containing protein
VEEKIASLHLDQLAEDLHYLKGSALNLGFSTFAELCTRYEDQLRNGQKAPELDTLDGCFQASKGAFLAAIASK